MAHWHGNGEWFCLRCNQSVKKANLLVHSCYQGGFNIRCFSCRQLIGSSERVAELHLKEFHGQENTSLDALYGEKCPKCARRYKALAIHMGKTHPCSENTPPNTVQPPEPVPVPDAEPPRKRPKIRRRTSRARGAFHQLEDEITSMENTISKLKIRILEQKSKLDKQKTASAKTVGILEDDIEVLQERMGKVKRKNEYLKHDLEDKVSAEAEHTQRFVEMRYEIAGLKEELGNVRTDVDLESDLRETKTLLANEIQEANKLRELLKKVRKEKEDMQVKFKRVSEIFN